MKDEEWKVNVIPIEEWYKPRSLVGKFLIPIDEYGYCTIDLGGGVGKQHIDAQDLMKEFRKKGMAAKVTNGFIDVIITMPVPMDLYETNNTKKALRLRSELRPLGDQVHE